MSEFPSYSDRRWLGPAQRCTERDRGRETRSGEATAPTRTARPGDDRLDESGAGPNDAQGTHREARIDEKTIGETESGEAARPFGSVTTSGEPVY
jgi:hypothetical protein